MKPTKLIVGVSQKINLGNYETRDIHVSIELDDVENLDEAYEFGKEYCTSKTKEYYDFVKDEMRKVDELSTAEKQKHKDLITKINNATTEDELMELASSVMEILDNKARKELQRLYNIKKIELHDKRK